MTPADAFELASEAILLVALGVALYTDLTRGKVYDWCTFPAICLGLLLSYVAGAYEPAQGAALVRALGGPLIASLAGLALALGLFGVAYLLKMLGGGDVKLMCAVGALKGLQFFIVAAFFTACAGAIIAVAVLIWRDRLKEGLRGSLMALFAPLRFKKHREAAPPDAAELTMIPYVGAIVVGTVAALVLEWL